MSLRSKTSSSSQNNGKLDRSSSFRRRASIVLNKHHHVDDQRYDFTDEVTRKVLENVVFLSMKIEQAGEEILYHLKENSAKSDLETVFQKPSERTKDPKSQTVETAFDNLVKTLKNQEEPLFTFNLYPEFVTASATIDPDYQESLIRSLVNLLPPNCFKVTERLFSFFVQLTTRLKKRSISITPAMLGEYFGPIFLSPFGGEVEGESGGGEGRGGGKVGERFEDRKTVFRCVKLLVQGYGKFFTPGGTGDPVCSKLNGITAVLYASVPITVTLLQDPYYCQQDPTFPQVIFTTYSYFMSASDLLCMLMEKYGDDFESKKSVIETLSGRLDRKSSEKRLVKNLSRKLSQKLLGLLDCEEDGTPTPSGSTDVGGGEVLKRGNSSFDLGRREELKREVLVARDKEEKEEEDSEKEPKKENTKQAQTKLRPHAVHLTMASSHIKLSQNWHQKRDQQVISALKEWIRSSRGSLAQDEQFVALFKMYCRQHPELDESPHLLLKHLLKNLPATPRMMQRAKSEHYRSSHSVTHSSSSSSSSSSSVTSSPSEKSGSYLGKSGGAPRFGTFKRKKKPRDKMRDIKFQAEKEQEKSKVQERSGAVEKLNPLFGAAPTPPPPSSSSSPENPLLQMSATKETVSISDPKAASCFRKVTKILDQADRFACYLTVLDFQLFKKIGASELLNGNFNKAEKAPNFALMAQQFNKTSSFVASHIVLTHNIEARVKQVARFLDIAKSCRDMNNFNTLFAIMTGLNNSGVSRLKKTWDALSQKKQMLLAELNLVTQFTNNFRNYTVIESATDPPLIPFLGYIARSLESTEAGNPLWMDNMVLKSKKERKKREREEKGEGKKEKEEGEEEKEEKDEKEQKHEKGKEEKEEKEEKEHKKDTKKDKKEEKEEKLLNFDKLRIVHQIVSEVQKKQDSAYELEDDMELTTLLLNVPILTDDELFEQSYICEPRGG